MFHKSTVLHTFLQIKKKYFLCAAAVAGFRGPNKKKDSEQKV
jgi:hypothetical protein